MTIEITADNQTAKFLVLKSGHNLSTDQVKEWAGATKIRHLTLMSNHTAVETVLYNAFESQLEAIDMWEEGEGLDIYLLNGETASSKYFDLFSDYFIGAYELSQLQLMHTQHVANLIHNVNWTRKHLERACNSHNRMLNDPDSSAPSTSLPNMSAQLASLSANYGTQELADYKDMIRNTLTNRW